MPQMQEQTITASVDGIHRVFTPVDMSGNHQPEGVASASCSGGSYCPDDSPGNTLIMRYVNASNAVYQMDRAFIEFDVREITNKPQSCNLVLRGTNGNDVGQIDFYICRSYFTNEGDNVSSEDCLGWLRSEPGGSVDISNRFAYADKITATDINSNGYVYASLNDTALQDMVDRNYLQVQLIFHWMYELEEEKSGGSEDGINYIRAKDSYPATGYPTVKYKPGVRPMLTIQSGYVDILSGNLEIK
tara:strand:+ start:2499 stop:3233 length:735 start_codon:yes stop_codon:yes gene_type:complete